MAVDDSNTKVLLHMDGADASTTFTDESGKTWPANGNAQIDTAQSVFGGASGLFDGTGGYIITPNSTDFDRGTNDWTVDMRVRRNGAQALYDGLFSPSADAAGGWGVQFNASSAPILITRAGGGNTIRATGSALADATWVHVAVVRSGNTVYIFQDGVQTTSASVTGISFNSGGTGAAIGRRNTDENFAYYNGWIDELRFSHVARWTTNFTPPASAYAPASTYYGVILWS